MSREMVPVDAMGEVVCYRWQGAHIPGCMGCAVWGHDRCTCNGRVGYQSIDGTGPTVRAKQSVTRKDIQDLEDLIFENRDAIEALTARVAALSLDGPR